LLVFPVDVEQGAGVVVLDPLSLRLHFLPAGDRLGAIIGVPTQRKKNRRDKTPEGIRPRRLTLQRAPRHCRVALQLVVRRLEINLLAEPLSRSLSRRLPCDFMALSEESK
jgi:hypothetical protein